MENIIISSFGGIIQVCWRILNIKIIADTYSLWNVFQGVFLCWGFKVVIMDGVLGYSGRAFGGVSYGHDKRGNRNNVYRHKEVE